MKQSKAITGNRILSTMIDNPHNIGIYWEPGGDGMETTLKETILEHIQNKDMENLKNLLVHSDNMEIVYAMTDFSPEEEVIVFRLLTKDDALEVFEYLDNSLQQKLLKSFTAEKAIEIMSELPPDDRVRLMEEMPAIVAKKLINSLSREEREATNILVGYEPETAGRIMTTEYISLRRFMTVSDALQRIREQAKEKETIYTLYVTDNSKKLEGVLTLKELLVSEPESKIEDVMSETVIKVTTGTDQEEAANTLHDLDLLAVPVVDREDRLVGIVTYDDVLDILQEETTEDIFDHAGLADTNSEVDRSELLVNGSLWKIWRVRLPILLITLGFGMFSGLIIDEFEQTLESISLVAIFIPLIMAMGGSVGTQSSTVFARGVVLGHIQTKKFMGHFMKEIGVGFSIGCIVGVITGVVATVWLGMPMLGLAVGFSLIATMTVASLLGFLVPFMLIKLNLDQAAGSAPIITSVKDIVGLLIYFVLVSLFMGHLL